MHEYTEAEKSVAQQSAAIQADFLTTHQRATFPKLSALEMQELLIGERMLRETHVFAAKRDAEHLAEFVQQCA